MLSGANAKQMVVIHVEQGHAAVRNMVLVVCQLARTACLVFQLYTMTEITVTDAFAALHCMCVPQWADYKVVVMSHRVLNSIWSKLMSLICLVVIVCAHTHHAGCRFWHIVYLPSAVVHSQLLHPSSGTACLLTFSHPPP